MTNFNASASHISMMHRPFGPRMHMDENAAGGAPAGGGADAGGGASMPESFSDVGSAYRHMVSEREKSAKTADGGEAAGNDSARSQNSNAGAEPAAAEAELSDEGNADPETGHGETQDADAAKQPPIERPKSWSKDEDAVWQSVPRDLQQKIVARESERDKGTTQSQQKAAEAAKVAEAKAAQAEQARQTYENHAKQALNVLLREQQRDFADIKSMEDVTMLSKADPLRYLQWQAHQQELQVQAAAVKDAEDQSAKQKSGEWNTFRSEQDKLAVEHIPDLGNAEKAPALMKKAVDYLLQELKFTPEELGSYDNGEKLSLFDHRLQRVIFDAVRYQDMQKAAAKAVAKPVPSVARPGARPSGGGSSERLQSLNMKLTNSGSLKDAAALLSARRAARR